MKIYCFLYFLTEEKCKELSVLIRNGNSIKCGLVVDTRKNF